MPRGLLNAGTLSADSVPCKACKRDELSSRRSVMGGVMPWPKCHQRRTHGTASPALLGRREPFSLALRPCCSRPPAQERAIAPRFATTSLHTLRKPRAQAAATRCAFGEAQIARTRALKAVLPKGGRFALKSPSTTPDCNSPLSPPPQPRHSGT